MTDPIPPNRSLMLFEENSLISPDTRTRILALREKNLLDLQIQFYIKHGIMFGGAGLLVLSFLTASSGNTLEAFYFVIVAVAAGGFGIMTDEKRAEKMRELRSIIFPCPRCNEIVDLGQPWACGNCKHENGKEKGQLAIPFDKCLHGSCSEPLQSAYQCPDCHNHIVLNQKLYIQQKSFQSPYKNVARYTTDTSPPLPAKPLASSADTFFDNDGPAFED